MTLRELIARLGLNGTPGQIAEALNAKSVPIYRSENITSAGLIIEIGTDLASQALASLEAAMNNTANPLAPLLRSQYQKLNSTGLDFSHPLTQQLIDQLSQAGVFSADLAGRLKAVGVRHISPYEQVAGEGQVVTVEQVQAALQPPAITGQRRVLSVVLNPDGNVCSLVVSQIAGDEVVSTVSYGAVNNRTSGDQTVDGLFTQVKNLLSQVTLG